MKDVTYLQVGVKSSVKSGAQPAKRRAVREAARSVKSGAQPAEQRAALRAATVLLTLGGPSW